MSLARPRFIRLGSRLVGGAVGPLQFKVYDLGADGKTLTDEMIETAGIALREGARHNAETMGDSNGVGFVIRHPRALGPTIAAQ